MSLEVTYKNQQIAQLAENGSLTLETAGKYCEDDIEISYSGAMSFTEFAIFERSGLTASAWVSTDGLKSITMTEGTWATNDYGFVGDGATALRTNLAVQPVLLAMRCKIASDFVPINNSYWYNQSCLFGVELANTQQDFGVTLVSQNDGVHVAIGYSLRSYAASTNAISLGVEHLIQLFIHGNSYRLYVDGQLEAEVSYSAYGTYPTTVGILWNNMNGTASTYNTIVKAEVSAFGIWSVENIPEYDTFPSLPTDAASADYLAALSSLGVEI